MRSLLIEVLRRPLRPGSARRGAGNAAGAAAARSASAAGWRRRRRSRASAAGGAWDLDQPGKGSPVAPDDVEAVLCAQERGDSAAQARLAPIAASGAALSLKAVSHTVRPHHARGCTRQRCLLSAESPSLCAQRSDRKELGRKPDCPTSARRLVVVRSSPATMSCYFCRSLRATVLVSRPAGQFGGTLLSLLTPVVDWRRLHLMWLLEQQAIAVRWVSDAPWRPLGLAVP